MTSALRLAISLVLSLVLWLLTLPAALAMDAGPEEIAVRYLVALLIARLGVGLVFRIVNGYAAANHVVEEVPEREDTDGPGDLDDAPYGRRRTDYTPPEAELSDEQLLDGALEEAHEAATLVSDSSR